MNDDLFIHWQLNISIWSEIKNIITPVRVDQKLMPTKGYSIYPKAPEVKTSHLMLLVSNPGHSFYLSHR